MVLRCGLLVMVGVVVVIAVWVTVVLGVWVTVVIGDYCGYKVSVTVAFEV